MAMTLRIDQRNTVFQRGAREPNPNGNTSGRALLWPKRPTVNRRN